LYAVDLTLFIINDIIFKDRIDPFGMNKANSNALGCPISRGAGVSIEKTNQTNKAPLVDYRIVREALGETRVLGPEFCPNNLLPRLGQPPRDEDIAIPIRQRCLKTMMRGGAHEHVILICVPFFLPVQVIAKCYPRLFGDTEGLHPVGKKDGLLRPPGSPDWIWYAVPNTGAHNQDLGTINVAEVVYANLVFMRTFSRHLFPERVACRSVKRNPFMVTVEFGKNGIISIPKVNGRVSGHLYAYGVELQ